MSECNSDNYITQVDKEQRNEAPLPETGNE